MKRIRNTHTYKLALSAFLCGETPFRVLNRLGRAYVRKHDTPEGWSKCVALDRFLGLHSVFRYRGTDEELMRYYEGTKYGYWNFPAPDCNEGTIGTLVIW